MKLVKTCYKLATSHPCSMTPNCEVGIFFLCFKDFIVSENVDRFLAPWQPYWIFKDASLK